MGAEVVISAVPEPMKGAVILAKVVAEIVAVVRVALIWR